MVSITPVTSSCMLEVFVCVFVCACALCVCVCVCVRVCVAGVVAKGKYFLHAQKENAHSVSNAIKHVCGEYIMYIHCVAAIIP